MKIIYTLFVCMFLVSCGHSQKDMSLSQKKFLLREMVNIWESLDGEEAIVGFSPRGIKIFFRKTEEGEKKEFSLAGDVSSDNIKITVSSIDNIGYEKNIIEISLGSVDDKKTVQVCSDHFLPISRMLDIYGEMEGSDSLMYFSKGGTIMSFSFNGPKKKEDCFLLSVHSKDTAPTIFVRKESGVYQETYGENGWQKLGDE